MERCLFPARVGNFKFDAILYKVLSYLHLACKQLCFPPGKGVNRRTESTNLELFGTLSESCILNVHSVVLAILTSIHLFFFVSTTENCKTAI